MLIAATMGDDIIIEAVTSWSVFLSLPWDDVISANLSVRDSKRNMYNIL